MRLSTVPVNMYKKFFVILLCVFLGLFTLEFIASLLGNPLSEISINGAEVIPETPLDCLLNAAITASFVGGIVNFFLVVKVIKEAFGLTHWPAIAVVLMTVFFPLELLIGAVLILPNIIIFGLKGRVKNRAYEVEF